MPNQTTLARLERLERARPRRHGATAAPTPDAETVRTVAAMLIEADPTLPASQTELGAALRALGLVGQPDTQLECENISNLPDGEKGEMQNAG